MQKNQAFEFELMYKNICILSFVACLKIQMGL